VQPFGKYRKISFRGRMKCPHCGGEIWITNIDRFLLSCTCISEYDSRGDP
jgi:hypothetical protein